MDEEALTLEDSIAILLAQVPPPVRQFVLNDLSQTTSRLMQRHQLHVDQGGVLERELLLMLLGQSTPEEFVKSLEEASINEATVKNLTEDVNKEVFMRLREEERVTVNAPKSLNRLTEQPIPAPTAPIAPPVAPARTALPIYSPLPSAPVLSAPPPYVIEAVERPQRQVPPPPVLPGQMPEPPRPTPPPRIEVSAPKVIERPEPAAEAPSQILHTMARDMQALKSGADPLRVAHPAPPAWANAPTPKPKPAVQLPVPVEPSHALPPHEETAPLAPHPQEALRTHLKQYGVDPYREPVQ